MENSKKPQEKIIAQNNYYSGFSEDEIDLYELVMTIWKRKSIVVVTTIIFIISALFYIFVSRPVYERKMLVRLQSNLPLSSSTKTLVLISPEEAKEIIENLNALIKEKRYQELSQKLNISTEEAKEIVKLQPQTIRKSEDLLKIVIRVHDKELLKNLPQHILNYINENKYLKEKMKLWKGTLTNQEKTIESRLMNIEKFKNYVLSEIEKGKLKILGFNPLDLEGYILSLKQQLQTIKAEKKLLTGAEAISLDPIPKKPSKPKKALILSVATITGLFLGIFLTFLVEWWNKAREQHAQNT